MTCNNNAYITTQQTVDKEDDFDTAMHLSFQRHWSLFSTYWRYTNKIIIIIIIIIIILSHLLELCWMCMLNYPNAVWNENSYSVDEFSYLAYVAYHLAKRTTSQTDGRTTYDASVEHYCVPYDQLIKPVNSVGWIPWDMRRRQSC